MVSANQGIRNNTVKLGNSIQRSSPFHVTVGNVPYTLGNITETDDLSDLLLVLVINDPIVERKHFIGILLTKELSVTDYGKGIGVIERNLLAVKPGYRGLKVFFLGKSTVKTGINLNVIAVSSDLSVKDTAIVSVNGSFALLTAYALLPMMILIKIG